jgi:hypothetical protein
MYYDKREPCGSIIPSSIVGDFGDDGLVMSTHKKKSRPVPRTFSRLPDTMMDMDYRYKLWKLLISIVGMASIGRQVLVG